MALRVKVGFATKKRAKLASADGRGKNEKNKPSSRSPLVNGAFGEDVGRRVRRFTFARLTKHFLKHY